MKKFSIEQDGIEFEIRVEKDQFHKSTKSDKFFDFEDLKDLKNGSVCFYKLEIISTKSNNILIHVNNGYLMSSNEDEIIDELEDLIVQEEIFEHIIKHHKLEQSSNGPEWKHEI